MKGDLATVGLRPSLDMGADAVAAVSGGARAPEMVWSPRASARAALGVYVVDIWPANDVRASNDVTAVAHCLLSGPDACG
jgi:hypothetical protein